MDLHRRGSVGKLDCSLALSPFLHRAGKNYLCFLNVHYSSQEHFDKFPALISLNQYLPSTHVVQNLRDINLKWQETEMRTAGSQVHYFSTSSFREMAYVLRSASQKEKWQPRADALSLALTRMQNIPHTRGRHAPFFFERAPVAILAYCVP